VDISPNLPPRISFRAEAAFGSAFKGSGRSISSLSRRMNMGRLPSALQKANPPPHGLVSHATAYNSAILFPALFHQHAGRVQPLDLLRAEAVPRQHLARVLGEAGRGGGACRRGCG
jgi:hypothetical protein